MTQVMLDRLRLESRTFLILGPHTEKWSWSLSHLSMVILKYGQGEGGEKEGNRYLSIYSWGKRGLPKHSIDNSQQINTNPRNFHAVKVLQKLKRQWPAKQIEKL